MMTCEQFVYWLSGYLTAGKDNDADFIVEEIKETMKIIRSPCRTDETIYYKRDEE